jgi:hypothetical protein
VKSLKIVTKEHLDKRICDVEKEAGNTQTYREYILEGEKEFDLIPKDLDGMRDGLLNEYLEFIDYLWTK